MKTETGKADDGRSSQASGSVTGLGKDCGGQTIIPIPGRRLSCHTNRHSNTDGTSWGWVDGCTANICWSNNKWFNHTRADEMVKRYNESQNDKVSGRAQQNISNTETK